MTAKLVTEVLCKRSRILQPLGIPISWPSKMPDCLFLDFKSTLQDQNATPQI